MDPRWEVFQDTNVPRREKLKLHQLDDHAAARLVKTIEIRRNIFKVANESSENSELVDSLNWLKYHMHTLSIAGQLLCGGLFSGDKLSNWFSAVGVAHGLMDQEEIKQDLLRVQLSTSTANTPVSLMQQVMAVVIKTGQVQTRLGLLMLIRYFLQLIS